MSVLFYLSSTVITSIGKEWASRFAGRLLLKWFHVMSRRMTKQTKCPVRPAKTQISLSIRPVWSVFAVRMKKLWVLSYSLTAQRKFWSDWADAQAELSDRWAHRSFCWVCRATALLSSLPLGAGGGLRCLIVALSGDLFIGSCRSGKVYFRIESWFWSFHEGMNGITDARTLLYGGLLVVSWRNKWDNRRAHIVVWSAIQKWARRLSHSYLLKMTKINFSVPIINFDNLIFHQN